MEACVPVWCCLQQIFGSSSKQEIEDGVRDLALGFVGLAIGAGLANFSAVSYGGSRYNIIIGSIFPS